MFSMLGYGLAVEFAAWVDIDKTTVDFYLKRADGFMGYDDKGATRYYFYGSDGHRNAAMDRISMYDDRVVEVGLMKYPVCFEYKSDWLNDSSDEIRT